MDAVTVLLIDDEEKLRSLLKRIISLEGFTVIEAGSLKEANSYLQRDEIDILLCDVKLPDGNGVDFVAETRKKNTRIPIILLTAFGNIADGVQAMKNGAFDYIIKGDDNEKVVPLLHRAAELVDIQRKLAHLQRRLGRQYSFDAIIGNSAAIRNAVELAVKVAATDANVLLLGETGTGKEVFAQSIHQASQRSGEEFVAINCSAFSNELLESELFGYKAGAFTGAVKDKKGLLEEANSGTLFLDEIGEMPLTLQVKLLRVLETKQFIKIGGTKSIKADIRIIAATNRHLQQEVEEGKFREDLFYRLNVFSIEIPSLRDRISDIPLLANHFLALFNEKMNKKIDAIDEACWPLLIAHNWKGNIRELKNIIERAVILAAGPAILPTDLPNELQQLQSQKTGTLSAFDLASVEKLHIQRVLNHTGGNKTETARLLNIGLTTLYRKIEEYGIRTT
ncbi:sigma-54-dependent transcriptional regulator [Flavihumibacter profundi]|uniref:sigma-54-dependent transcriptional regulator n=1 Tax=Flavihumibacter profundi TaxID=2716883 RepID=UPI001CC77AC7|nr:sigma-54 dependent transcriptional regulator [Flavihumibacter profundi]MBZ5858616.1 sigma-54 dependent transcriptional regulator [Flavihumibacter profundi]